MIVFFTEFLVPLVLIGASFGLMIGVSFLRMNRI